MTWLGKQYYQDVCSLDIPEQSWYTVAKSR